MPCWSEVDHRDLAIGDSSNGYDRYDSSMNIGMLNCARIASPTDQTY